MYGTIHNGCSIIAGSDYVPVDVTLTFTPTNFLNPMEIQVQIMNDDIPEPEETVNIELSIPVAFSNLAFAGDPSLSPLTISDDDGMYTVQLITLQCMRGSKLNP